MEERQRKIEVPTRDDGHTVRVRANDERLEKEEEARRTRTRREDTVNCLKIFSDGACS